MLAPSRFWELLACPACRGAVATAADEPSAAVRCFTCDAEFPVVDGIANLRIKPDARTDRVRMFYSAYPFPNYPPGDTLSGLRRRAERSEFARLLDRAIPGDARVLEVGCG